MSKNKFKSKRRSGLFNKETSSLKISNIGELLDKLDKVIDFEMFRGELEKGMLDYNKENNSEFESFDVVMMFKIMVIKRIYNLNDEQAEYQIIDRSSFKKFLGLSSGDEVPDARTIRLFQNNLIEKQLEERLFTQFHKYLEEEGLLLVHRGKIIDATLRKHHDNGIEE